MKWQHVVKGGKIITPNSKYIANIYINNGKIVAISDKCLGGDARKVTDANGLYILPGLIDSHIHSRDGGATHKEDFYHSTLAAASGGVTTVFEMPNTNPTVNNSDNFDKQYQNLISKANVNFGLWGICLGELNNKDLSSLDNSGVIGFKYFWGYAVDKENYQLLYNYSEDSVNIIPPCSDGEVFEIFEEVAKTGKTIGIHAENNELINHLTKKTTVKNGDDYEFFLKTRPKLAEELTIQTGISIAKETGARLHILHVSTAEGVNLIRNAQKEGYPITAETCPHYLFLTNKDYEKIGSKMKVYPLIKYEGDQKAIWEGIHDGTISIISSDHAPHTKEEKCGDLWSIPAGMCGVETLGPLMLNAVSEGKVSIHNIVSLLSENPARQYNVFPQKGCIQVGSDADLTIVDMERKYTIREDKLHSKSKITAYDGLDIQGMPVITIVNGKTVMEYGKILIDNAGELIKPK